LNHSPFFYQDDFHKLSPLIGCYLLNIYVFLACNAIFTNKISPSFAQMYPRHVPLTSFSHLLLPHITNFIGNDLAIIVMWNMFFIGSYEIDINVIHLLVLFEHQCYAHCLDMNVICLFMLFRQRCCMSIGVVYTQKLCTWLLCLNNAWHLCLNNMNLWNNTFCTNLEQTHKAYKFVMHSTPKTTRQNNRHTYTHSQDKEPNKTK